MPPSVLWLGLFLSNVSCLLSCHMTFIVLFLLPLRSVLPYHDSLSSFINPPSPPHTLYTLSFGPILRENIVYLSFWVWLILLHNPLFFFFKKNIINFASLVTHTCKSLRGLWWENLFKASLPWSQEEKEKYKYSFSNISFWIKMRNDQILRAGNKTKFKHLPKFFFLSLKILVKRYMSWTLPF